MLELEKIKEDLELEKIPTLILLEEFRKRYLLGEVGIWTREDGMMLVDEKSKKKLELSF